MKVVGVAGHRNTGKTTLVEGLIRAIPAHLHVATVKSIHHDVEFDSNGEDTHRHRTAGADTVVGVTPSLTATFRTRGKQDGVELEDQLETLAKGDTDWVLVEGFKSAAIPTILVGDIDREAVGGSILFRLPDGTNADAEHVWGRLDGIPDWYQNGSR